jgi:enoyl-CoA hydratase
MSYESLLVERQDALAQITINRPTKLNALNNLALGELEQVVKELEADASVRAVVLTGAGTKAFVAGADIGEMADITPAEAGAHAARGQRVMSLIEGSRLPYIAAINGFALGGGLELALACDIRIAAETAQLGLPEVTLGLIPGFGGTQRLPRVLPRGKALELILSGDRVDAKEAYRIGLVDRLATSADLLAEAHKLARTIARRAPQAVALAKRSVHVGVENDMNSGLAYEAAQFAIAFSTADHTEGIKAFLEKREASFTGK